MSEFCSPEWRCLGTCETATSVCECTGDQRHDFVLARFRNCGAPSRAAEHAAIGLSIALGTIISIRNLLQYRKAKARTKNVIAGAIFANVFLTAGVIVHLVQGFASPAFWFLLAGFGGAIGASLAAIFDAFLRISYGAAMVAFPEAFAYSSFALMVASLIAPFIVSFVGSLQDSDDVFHTYLAVGFGLIPLHLFVSAPLLFSCIAQLIARTDAAANQPIEAAPAKVRAPSIFGGAIPQTSFRSPRLSDASLPGTDKPRRASALKDENNGNNGSFKEQMRRMGKRIRLFRFLMVFLWAPFEVIVSAGLTCMVVYRLPYLTYAFFILINLAQFVSLTFVAVVKSTSSRKSYLRGVLGIRRPSLFPSVDGGLSDPMSSPISDQQKTPNF